MKKRILIASTAALVLLSNASFSASAAQVHDFKDVSASAWYYSAVEYAADSGLFSGTSNTTFGPELGMTRGMFVTVLGRQARIKDEKPQSTSFTDVAPSAYYAPYVEWAKENEIVSGTSQTTFSPDQQITREQMATMLYRYAEKASCDLTLEPNSLTALSDQVQISSYAREAMEWAVSHKIISGTGAGLNPRGTATRAQVAQVFYNACEVLRAARETPTEDGSAALLELRSLVSDRLPESCRWDERALEAGWYGPMTLRMNGSLENIAEGCVYLLTELDGVTYDIWYLTEPEPGAFVCYYG